MSTIKAQANS